MTESVCFGEVFSFAPPVAAQMILDRTLLVSKSCSLDSFSTVFHFLQPEDYKEIELDFLKRRLLRSNTSRKPPKFVLVNAQANPAPMEVTVKSNAPDKKEGYSDTVLLPPGWSGSVPHRAHQSIVKTVTGDRGQDSLPLETIAETDSQVSSSLLASGSKGGRGMVFTKRRDGSGGKEMKKEESNSIKILAERSEDSPPDSRQQLSPYQPRVLITSNVIPTSSSSRAKPLTPAR